jgi:hypothetical protein
MEALLEREDEQVENWNDDRLDELSRRMDAGFEKTATKVELGGVREEMNRRFDEVDARFGRFEASLENQFGRVNERLDRLMLGMVFVATSFVLTMVAEGIFG